MILLSETHRHPKIIKNGKLGIESAILHLAPATMSGYEVCPMRSKGCTKACLNFAGFQYARKYDARIARTKWFFEDRRAFLKQLVKEIITVAARAERTGYQCGIRLNGTSDIRWEEITLDGPTLMEIFPQIAFMDYTKQPDRKNLPDNYRLTFSRSENNHHHCIEALKNGMNVACVFLDVLPDTATLDGQKLRVIDGDEHDWRYGDYDDYPNERVIVGLRAKGLKAKQDNTGFVVNPYKEAA